MLRYVFILFCFLFSSLSANLASNSLLDNRSSVRWVDEFDLAKKLTLNQEYDLAIESLKKAWALCPPTYLQDRQSIEFAFINLYYLRKDYFSCTRYFEKSSLLYANANFIDYKKMLFMLYCAYMEIEKEDKASKVLTLLLKEDPLHSNELVAFHALNQKDFKPLLSLDLEPSHQKVLKLLINRFEHRRKSIQKAKWLSLVLPGLGYYYANQKQTALTSFTLNSLFIASTIKLISLKIYPLALFTFAFELGWYFGGMKGSMRAVKQHNDFEFEKLKSEVMEKKLLGEFDEFYQK